MTVKLDYIKVNDVEILSGRKVDFQLSYQTFGQDYKNFPCKCGSKNCVGYIVREGSRWRIKKIRNNKR